jgi:hypothetical protein
VLLRGGGLLHGFTWLGDGALPVCLTACDNGQVAAVCLRIPAPQPPPSSFLFIHFTTTSCFSSNYAHDVACDPTTNLVVVY